MTVGEAVQQRILQLCQERDISINKLSSISGVTQSTVNNIVSGRNNSATVSTIKKPCDGLGIAIDDFFHSELFAGPKQEIKQMSPAARKSIHAAAIFCKENTGQFSPRVHYVFRPWMPPPNHFPVSFHTS